MNILYLIEIPLYFIIFKIFSYRVKIIEKNIFNSFSRNSKQELKSIIKKFQFHFIQQLIEGVKNISISSNELKKRFVFENIELLNEILKEKSVVMVSSHYNNWEWLITSLGIHIKQNLFGIGMPITNQFINVKLNKKRERYGLKVINSMNYKSALKQSPKPFAVLTLCDQSPSCTTNAFWTNFLNQKTGVIFGPEFIAHEFETAVVYLKTTRIKKGYYSCSVELISNNTEYLEYGDITLKHVEILENQILENPSYWLWSHNRWKKKQPVDQDELFENQKLRFTTKFKK